MEFDITIEPETYIIGKNLNNLKVTRDGQTIAMATLSLDEIEDLESNLTDVLIKLSRYRRNKQREEL